MLRIFSGLANSLEEVLPILFHEVVKMLRIFSLINSGKCFFCFRISDLSSQFHHYQTHAPLI